MLRLTVLACVPVAETIEESSGCKTLVKWPNDVEIGGKKVAGLLVESASKGNDIAYMVLGIGVNLNIEPAMPGRPGGDVGERLLRQAGRPGRVPEPAAVPAGHILFFFP